MQLHLKMIGRAIKAIKTPKSKQRFTDAYPTKKMPHKSVIYKAFFHFLADRTGLPIRVSTLQQLTKANN